MMSNGKHKLSAGIAVIAQRLTGSSREFSMEARIFHATCLVSLVTIVINIPMNYLVGVPSLSLLMTALFFIVTFIYYYARFKRRLNTSFFLFCVLSNVFFTLNYYQKLRHKRAQPAHLPALAVPHHYHRAQNPVPVLGGAQY